MPDTLILSKNLQENPASNKFHTLYVSANQIKFVWQQDLATTDDFIVSLTH